MTAETSPENVTSNAITLTEAATARIKTLTADSEHIALRVTVSGGGCSGFQYHFKFEDSINNDDIHIEKDGALLLSDSATLDILKGSEVDFVDNLMGQMFKVNNPNAESMCGCGTSFSIKF